MTDKQFGAPEIAAPEPKKTNKRRNTLLWIVGPALVLGIAGYIYLTSGRFVSTDNAYVQADHATIAPQISGRVVEVLVHDTSRSRPATCCSGSIRSRSKSPWRACTRRWKRCAACSMPAAPAIVRRRPT